MGNRLILIICLATAILAGQVAFHGKTVFRGSVTAGPHNYLDAVTGNGSDANPGTAARPWATLAHADSVLPTNAPVTVMYPDGVYRSAPPVWHNFLSYYAFLPGQNQQLLYDIYNGHHAVLSSSCWIPTWTSTGLYFGPQANVSQGGTACAIVNNFSSYAPTSAGAFVIGEIVHDWTKANEAFVVGSLGETSTNEIWGLLPNNGSGGWYFGTAPAGKISASIPPSVDVQHIWGMLAGGNYQALYLDGTLKASQASNQSFTRNGAGVTDLYIGGQQFGGNRTMNALMISASTLADADYLTLQSWISGTELTRLPFPPNYYPALTTLPSNGLALVPPMGWDAWRVYGANATDTEVRANADAIVSKGLLAAGYTLVNPNDSWTVGGSRNSSGNLVSNSNFPDMAALGTYIRSKGLQLAMYLGPGAMGCNNFIGSQGHETTDAAQIVSWGATYLMYDNCSFFPSATEVQSSYQAMGQALQATGQSIIYVVSTPIQNAGGYNAYNSASWGKAAGGNIVFTAPDLGNTTWATMTAQIDGQYGLETYTAPGRWNMMDYLGTGNGILTDTEGQSHMALDSILASPLWISTNLTTASAATITTLTNSEVIAVDQDSAGIGGKRVSRVSCGDANCEVYARQLSGGAWAIVLFNRASTSQSISATWSMFGQTGPFTGRDLWAHSGLGTLTSGYTATVVSHGVVMVKLTS